MIIGVGIDVVPVERFAESLTRTPGLRDRLFTAAEQRTPFPRKTQPSGERGEAMPSQSDGVPSEERSARRSRVRAPHGPPG